MHRFQLEQSRCHEVGAFNGTRGFPFVAGEGHKRGREAGREQPAFALTASPSFRHKTPVDTDLRSELPAGVRREMLGWQHRATVVSTWTAQADKMDQCPFLGSSSGR
jgi:hypothetical protein